MNEKMKMLMEKSNLQPYYEAQEKHIEDFYTEIVQECIKVIQTKMYKLDSKPGNEIAAQTLDWTQEHLKNHFGV